MTVALNIALTAGDIVPESQSFNALMPHVTMRSVILDEKEYIEFQIVIFDTNLPLKKALDYFNKNEPVTKKSDGVYEIEMKQRTDIILGNKMTMVVIDGSFETLGKSETIELHFTHQNLNTEDTFNKQDIGDSITRRGTVSVTKRISCPPKLTS